MVYMDIGSKIHFHPWQIGYGNEYRLRNNRYTRMDDQRKDHPESEKSPKGTAHYNYRAITFILMMWKPLMAQIREKIYSSLISRGQFPRNRIDAAREPEEQDSFYVLINTSTRTAKRDEKMAWIDYKKVLDIILQSWIRDSLKMYKISDEVLKLIEETMKNWRMELTAGGKSLAEAKIQRGIFQRDVLSPWLFVIVMMLLNFILKK